METSNPNDMSPEVEVPVAEAFDEGRVADVPDQAPADACDPADGPETVPDAAEDEPEVATDDAPVMDEVDEEASRKAAIRKNMAMNANQKQARKQS